MPPPGPPNGPPVWAAAGNVPEGTAISRTTTVVGAAFPKPIWLPPNVSVTRTIGGSELVESHSGTQSSAFVSQHSMTKSFTLRASTSGVACSAGSTSMRIGFCRSSRSFSELETGSTVKVSRRRLESNLPLRGKTSGTRDTKLKDGWSPLVTPKV